MLAGMAMYVASDDEGIGPGGEVNQQVPADAECGSVITLTINVNSSLGPVSYTYNLQIGLPTSTGAAVRRAAPPASPS